MHKLANPDTGLLKGTQLGDIHNARINHCKTLLIQELMALRDPRVNALLDIFSVAILPGPRIGIDYPIGAPQILVDELAAEKLKLGIGAVPEPVGKRKKK